MSCETIQLFYDPIETFCICKRHIIGLLFIWLTPQRESRSARHRNKTIKPDLFRKNRLQLNAIYLQLSRVTRTWTIWMWSTSTFYWINLISIFDQSHVVQVFLCRTVWSTVVRLVGYYMYRSIQLRTRSCLGHVFYTENCRLQALLAIRKQRIRLDLDWTWQEYCQVA